MPGRHMAKIDLPYVKAYEDRNGLWRYYFRRAGTVYGAIPGKPGSKEFMDAYQEFLGNPSPKATRHEHGTMGALITSFYASPAFANLKPTSKTLYRKRVLEPFAALHGGRLVRDIRRDKLLGYIEGIGATRPAQANLVRSVLNKLMRHAIAKEWRRDNPIIGSERYKIGSHHTWTDAELQKFEDTWPVGTRERLAYALLLYTGQRGGDVVRMSKRDIVDGYIHVVQQKTGADLWIPLHPNLLTAIKATPTKGFMLLARANGQPIQRQTLTAMIANAVKKAGLPDYCVPHGIRKSTMRKLAEGGATAKEIAAISGHQTLKEIERYTEAADQKKLSKAAMATISPIRE